MSNNLNNVPPTLLSLLQSVAPGSDLEAVLNNGLPQPDSSAVSSSTQSGNNKLTLGLGTTVSNDEIVSNSKQQRDQGKNSSSSSSRMNQNECNYRDFSHIPPEENELHTIEQSGVRRNNTNNGGSNTNTNNNNNKSAMNFPTKLHDMLSREDLTDVIAWSNHGRSWRVLKPKLFEQRVLPEYFRHSKYNSFMRQVNGWGFRRISQGLDFNSYYHELFLRGMPHLVRRMRRIPAVTSRADGEVAYDPDFRTMPFVDGFNQGRHRPKEVPTPEEVVAVSTDSKSSVEDDDDVLTSVASNDFASASAPAPSSHAHLLDSPTPDITSTMARFSNETTTSTHNSTLVNNSGLPDPHETAMFQRNMLLAHLSLMNPNAAAGTGSVIPPIPMFPHHHMMSHQPAGPPPHHLPLLMNLISNQRKQEEERNKREQRLLETMAIISDQMRNHGGP